MKKLIPFLIFLASCNTDSCNKKVVPVVKEPEQDTLTIPNPTSKEGQEIISDYEVSAARGRKPPKPTATTDATVLLDFDGANVNSSYWNGGVAFTAAPSLMTIPQQDECIAFLRQDSIYGIYKIKFTTSETEYNAANRYKRIRVIITPTSAWKQGVSGIAYNESLFWGDETPAFVFSDRLYNITGYVARIISHEVGHCLSLNHVSDYNADCTSLINSYSMDKIMGNPLYVAMPVWWVGICSPYQDDRKILAAKLGLR